jgi:hypothetical protein
VATLVAQDLCRRAIVKPDARVVAESMRPRAVLR